MTEIFKGIREEWLEWRKMLKFKLREKGLESVAVNLLKRPPDIVAEYWAPNDANPPNQLQIEQLMQERGKAQMKWDEKNEKAYATLVFHLHQDISRQLDSLQDEGICHLALVYLEERYGGEPDAEGKAIFLKATAEKLNIHDTLETYISRFEQNHKMAGSDMQNGSALLAHFKVTLSDHSRTQEAFKRIRQLKMNWTDAKQCLIEEDRANPPSSFEAKEITFVSEGQLHHTTDTVDNDEISRKRLRFNTVENGKVNHSPNKRVKKLDGRENFQNRSGKRRHQNSAQVNSSHKSTNPSLLCYQFRDTGSCNFGEKCKYTHIPQSKVPQTIPQNNNKGLICKFWQQGKCNQGESCKFRHHA